MFWRTPPDVPLADAIREALVDFNHLDDVAVAQHRQRMRLLLGTPALLAHSELRYAAWRAVVADFVAQRLGVPADDLLPRLAGRVALSVACPPMSSGSPRKSDHFPSCCAMPAPD
jgi:hypothetical protein